MRLLKHPQKRKDPGGRKATEEALSHSRAAGLVTRLVTPLGGARERKVERAQEKNESQQISGCLTQGKHHMCFLTPQESLGKIRGSTKKKN